jgi:RNA polymerase sigma factor (sigma-70 family)
MLGREISFLFHPDFETPEEFHGDAPLVDRLLSDGCAVPLELRAVDGRLFGSLDSPLLTAAEELVLFRQLNYLKYLANQKRCRLNPSRPSRQRLDEIESDLDRAERIRERLAQANVRLVLSLARKSTNSGQDFEELVSDGLLILLGAIDRFDYARGFRFSTYATHAIRRFFYRQYKGAQRRRERCLTVPPELISDVPGPERSETDAELDPVAGVRSLLARVSECLDERESRIVQMRFGVGGTGESLTLREVADRLGISKERVRQLQLRALDKLRDLAAKLQLSSGA